MAEYVEGQARITTGDHSIVELDQDAITTDNVEPGDQFRFQNDHPGYYTVGAILTAQTFTITAPYTGPKTIGTYFDYLVLRDFTTNHGLAEMSPGDVDIREIFTFNMRRIDEILFIPSEFAAGVKLIFVNDVTPLGWTRVVDFNDRVLRIVSGSLLNAGESWVITGLTAGQHKHETVYAFGGDTGPIVIQDAASWPHGFSTAASKPTRRSVGATLGIDFRKFPRSGPPEGTTTIPSDGSWRPPCVDAILGCKD